MPTPVCICQGLSYVSFASRVLRVFRSLESFKSINPNQCSRWYIFNIHLYSLIGVTCEVRSSFLRRQLNECCCGLVATHIYYACSDQSVLHKYIISYTSRSSIALFNYIFVENPVYFDNITIHRRLCASQSVIQRWHIDFDG